MSTCDRSAQIPGTSHPSRVRGLKCRFIAPVEDDGIVAPFTGAWIEIVGLEYLAMLTRVAPFTGAWIEIFL